MKQNKTAKRKSWLLPLLLGVLCISLSALAVWFDLTHNGGKLVYPMDSYAFETTDIPMLLAIALDVVYAVYLVFRIIYAVCAQKRQILATNRTRRVSPKWGLLGFLGFFGFAGFYSYSAFGDLTPFCFFAFFGFFGFFFEGKMSNLLMDERYLENAAHAERTAYRTGFILVFLLLILSAQSSKLSAELTIAVLITGLALTVALTMFLSEYLLYRYDHDGAPEEDE